VLEAESRGPQCISEEELEAFDNVPKGKYTIGLGQKFMACCDELSLLALNAACSCREPP